MIKSELIATLIKRQPDMAPQDVELAVNCLLEKFSEELAAGQRIEIRGFGSFSVHQLSARQARNPKTGEPVLTPAKARVHFKPGKQLRNRVNDSRDQYSISRE
jgi:integration host factor subunit beta